MEAALVESMVIWVTLFRALCPLDDETISLCSTGVKVVELVSVKDVVVDTEKLCDIWWADAEAFVTCVKDSTGESVIEDRIIEFWVGELLLAASGCLIAVLVCVVIDNGVTAVVEDWFSKACDVEGSVVEACIVESCLVSKNHSVEDQFSVTFFINPVDSFMIGANGDEAYVVYFTEVCALVDSEASVGESVVDEGGAEVAGAVFEGKLVTGDVTDKRVVEGGIIEEDMLAGVIVDGVKRRVVEGGVFEGGVVKRVVVNDDLSEEWVVEDNVSVDCVLENNGFEGGEIEGNILEVDAAECFVAEGVLVDDVNDGVIFTDGVK